MPENLELLGTCLVGYRWKWACPLCFYVNVGKELHSMELGLLLAREAQECSRSLHLEIWCYRKGTKIQTKPLFLKGRAILKSPDLCIFIRSKLVGVSPIRDTVAFSLHWLHRKPRSGSPGSSRDEPFTMASGTGVTPPTAGGGGIGHSTSAQISDQEALSHCVDCRKISWEQHTSAEISGDGSYHARVVSCSCSSSCLCNWIFAADFTGTSISSPLTIAFSAYYLHPAH